VKWIQLSQNTVYWQNVLNLVIQVRVSREQEEIFFTNSVIVTLHGKTCTADFVFG
jgi:hypothetical protein